MVCSSMCLCLCTTIDVVFHAFLYFFFDIFTYSKNVMVLGSGNEVSQVKSDDRPP